MFKLRYQGYFLVEALRPFTSIPSSRVWHIKHRFFMLVTLKLQGTDFAHIRSDDSTTFIVKIMNSGLDQKLYLKTWDDASSSVGGVLSG